MKGVAWYHLPIARVADLDPERARAQAERHSIPACATVEELCADPEVEAVVNLTPPDRGGGRRIDRPHVRPEPIAQAVSAAP